MEDIKETPLCKLAFEYKTDKCPKIKHVYTPFYYELLKDRKNTIKKCWKWALDIKELCLIVEMSIKQVQV